MSRAVRGDLASVRRLFAPRYTLGGRPVGRRQSALAEWLLSTTETSHGNLRRVRGGMYLAARFVVAVSRTKSRYPMKSMLFISSIMVSGGAGALTAPGCGGAHHGSGAGTSADTNGAGGAIATPEGARPRGPPRPLPRPSTGGG